MIRRPLNDAPMPADLRARVIPPPNERGALNVDVFANRLLTTFEVVRPPTYTQQLVRRVGALVTLAGAIAFAVVAVGLATSKDPVTCIAPLGASVLMGWCARELWPARVARSIWITPLRGPRAGVGRFGQHAESAPVGKAPAATDL